MARIWKLGDNVNTDVIIPGRYNVTTDRAQLAHYCLYEVLPEFSQQVQAGDVVMAGHNFGCGSSREHAPAAILATGVIRNLTTGQTFEAEPLDPFVARIVAAGGIIEYIRQEGTLR